MLTTSLLVILLLAYGGLCLFYYLAQERLIFVRFRVGRKYRFHFEAPFRERWLKAPDGARLHALHFIVPEARGVVLYLHGNTGSLRRWGRFAQRFTALGFDVLMPDPRGYGKSRGELSEAALIDDARRWYAMLARHYAEAHIVVYGRSLGSGLATPVAAVNSPAALLLETPFADLLDVARHYLPILPYRWLLQYRFRNDLSIRAVRCPVWIFHGKRDTVVPYTSALKLYAAIPSGVVRELVTFPNGGHSDLGRFARYRSRLREALDLAAHGEERYLRRPLNHP
ncbi:MAG: alpha/beta fold hydrolase [Flavobacteriales bacterium]|nr:alpha/beta fold hydrolase [Flavobacteriales bacterium]